MSMLAMVAMSLSPLAVIALVIWRSVFVKECRKEKTK